MRRDHPEFGVRHLDETPVKRIPDGALIKWFDRRCGRCCLRPVAAGAGHERSAKKTAMTKNVAPDRVYSPAVLIPKLGGMETSEERQRHVRRRVRGRSEKALTKAAPQLRSYVDGGSETSFAAEREISFPRDKKYRHGGMIG